MSAEQKQLGGHRDLKVFQLACKLAMEIFNESKSIPKDERISLTDQIRRSSRSVAANIPEGFRKRQYPKMFISKLAESARKIYAAFPTPRLITFCQLPSAILPCTTYKQITVYIHSHHFKEVTCLHPF